MALSQGCSSSLPLPVSARQPARAPPCAQGHAKAASVGTFSDAKRSNREEQEDERMDGMCLGGCVADRNGPYHSGGRILGRSTRQHRDHSQGSQSKHSNSLYASRAAWGTSSCAWVMAWKKGSTDQDDRWAQAGIITWDGNPTKASMFGEYTSSDGQIHDWGGSVTPDPLEPEYKVVQDATTGVYTGFCGSTQLFQSEDLRGRQPWSQSAERCSPAQTSN